MIRARLEQLRWHVGRPFRAARLALRSLNYEPQHVDPWGPDAERIYDMPLGLGYNLPVTLPAPDFEPVLSGPRIVGGERIDLPGPDTDSVAAGEATRLPAPGEQSHAPGNLVQVRAGEPDLLLGEAWLHAHWWWYGQERQREADDYHTWVLADRRRWRAENGLAAVELAA